MDGSPFELPLFLLATFAGALVAGLSGFAFGLVAASIWLYSLYALFRPTIDPVKAGGAAADAGVGFLNGVFGGITGLAGILVTIWCGLRGWPKDVQRAVFQPVAVATC